MLFAKLMMMVFHETFIKLVNPTTLPGGITPYMGGNGITISPEGELIALAHDAPPYLMIYKKKRRFIYSIASDGNIAGYKG